MSPSHVTGRILQYTKFLKNTQCALRGADYFFDTMTAGNIPKLRRKGLQKSEDLEKISGWTTGENKMSCIVTMKDEELRRAILDDSSVISNLSYLGFDCFRHVDSNPVCFLLRVYEFLIDINRLYPTVSQEDISLEMAQITWIRKFLQTKVQKKIEVKFAEIFTKPRD